MIEMNREDVLSYIIHYLEYDIGFTEDGLEDKSNTQEDIDNMNSLIKKYKNMIEYVKENLK